MSISRISFARRLLGVVFVVFAVFVVTALAAACSPSDETNGPAACGPNDSCPAGYTCEPTSHLCVIGGNGPPDASVQSPPPDAASTDAPLGAAPAVTFLPGTTPDDGARTNVAAAHLVFDFAKPAAAVGAHLECSLDGAAFAACTSPVDVTVPIVTGNDAVTFIVRGVNAAGAGAPALRAWVLDTAKPVVALGGTPANASVTNDRSTAFTFAFAGNEPGGVLECMLAGPGTAEVFAAGNCRNRSGLGDGGWTFSLRGRDLAGNLSAVASAKWTVDTVGPGTTLTSADPRDGVSSVLATWTLEFTIDDVTATATCVFDGVAEACTSPASHTFANDGEHTAFVFATDLAGNPGPPTATLSYLLDTRAPHIIFDTVPRNGDVTFTITFHADETIVRFDSCEVDGGAPRQIPTCVTNADGSGSSVGSLAGSDTTQHSFTVNVRDAAGNGSTNAVTWTTN